MKGAFLMKYSMFLYLVLIHLVQSCVHEPKSSRHLAGAVFESTPIIPRDTLYGPGQFMRVRMSPDGQYLASIRPVELDGKILYNIFIAPLDKSMELSNSVLPKPVERMPIYSWTLNPGYMVYTRDLNGNENDQLFLVNLKDKTEQNLTQDLNVKVRGVRFNRSKPNLIYFSSNARDSKYFDYYVLDVTEKEPRLLFENKEAFLFVLFNDKDQPRFAYKYNEQGGMDTFIYSEKLSKWDLFKSIAFDYVPGFAVVSYDNAVDTLYYLDGESSDTGSLHSLNLSSRTQKTIVKSPKTQIGGVITSFDGTGGPLAYEVEFEKSEYVALNSKFKSELKSLYSQLPKGTEFSIVSQTPKDDKWLLAINSDRSSIHYYSWDRLQLEANFLFSMKPDLDKQPLVPMNPLVIKSRDGLNLVSYLTLPPGYEWDPKNKSIKGNPNPLPIILDVHGGPWARDSWGMSPTHQLYANRGYAVLSVNFRGSTGFGQAFERAGFGEWGAKMHDDLIDSVNWAIAQGIADEYKVVISGGSYGGYATLVGLTFTPDVFAAGINTVGVANLVTMQQSIPSYWKPFRANSIRRMGADVETEEGRAFLWSRSPLSKVHKIKRPLLIGHGDNDQRVRLEEATQITEAMIKLKLPVTLVRFSDEGHGFARPENSATFTGIEENFLVPILGGRSEPIKVHPKSTINVTEGANLIPGLCEALIATNKKGKGCQKK